jgi:hypothetical protein
MNTNVRNLSAQFDEQGNPFWKTRLSAPDNSFAQIAMIPDRVIPVIFVPGVMGSNLNGIGSSKGVSWLLDSENTMLGWTTKGPEYRKQHLTPSTMEVLGSGKIDPGQTGIPVEELQRRGWGEVGFMSYGKFLPWLEEALNDFQNPADGIRAVLRKDTLKALHGETPLSEDEFALSYKYRFPVYACGYNWLDSNVKASARLGQLIDAVIQRYKKQKLKCEKVIVVTHSMGGLVARHCSQVEKRQSQILGIVHGVMPAVGAAAVYRRFKSGTENFGKGFVVGVKGSIGGQVLGGNAAEMTAVLSTAPGPLQLLPTPEYGNGWLKIKDGAVELSLPKHGDPYGEIYVVPDKWWSMTEKHLINPLNSEADPKKRQTQMEADWAAFSDTIRDEVKPFHDKIRGQYHHNSHAFIGNGKEVNSVGNVRWQRVGTGRAPTDTLNARPTNPADIHESRSTMAKLMNGSGELPRHFQLQGPDETGDGTVPARSGLAARSYCKSFLQAEVEHEPAYKHGDGAEFLRACHFTLRAIVKIAQDVQSTSLKYD